MSPLLGGVTGPAQAGRDGADTAPDQTTATTGTATDAHVPRQGTKAARAGAPRRRQRLATAVAVLAGLVTLFCGYLRMGRSVPTNSDGAANALQAWDLLHGNLLLTGWTLSDVSFYTTELVQYALIEAVFGLNDDVVHIASAMTYTLLIVLAALVAKGDATGRAAWLRIGVVVATLLVPEAVSGYAVVLYSPDHTGTAVPLLATFLLISRNQGRRSRWMAVGVLLLLTVAQVGDPLAMFVGALPLALVSGLRMYKSRLLRGTDAHLLAASTGSVLLAQGLLRLVWWAGGFSVHPPIAALAAVGRLPGHVFTAVAGTALNYGAYFPQLDTPWSFAAGVVNLLALLLATCAVGLAATRLARRSRGVHGDRVADVLATAIMVNLTAFIVSTQAAADLGSARQIVAVLPFGAALAGRLCGDVLHAVRLPALPVDTSTEDGMPTDDRLHPWYRRLLPALLAVLAIAFVLQAATARPQPAEASQAAGWLQQQHLSYGLGSYWASNNVTVVTGGKVHVAPVIGPDIRAFRWESDADWYDAARHDARFVIIDQKHAHYGTVQSAIDQFGTPVQRQDFGRWAVLVYEHNLLVGLPAQCGGLIAAAHKHCPPMPPKVPGSSLIHR